MAVRLLLVCLLVACSAPSEDISAEKQPAFACSQYGFALPGAAVGDVYQACAPEILSVVVSNGDMPATVQGSCWSLSVAKLVGSGPLVVQFRDQNHATLCPALVQL